MKLLPGIVFLLAVPAAAWAQTAPRFIPLGQLAAPPEGLGSTALDVSSDGMVVVGGAYDGEHSVAARWTDVAGWESFGFLNPQPPFPASNYAQATDVDGNVVVGSIAGHSAWGFVWKVSTGVVVMPRLQGGQQLYVHDLSRNGRYVVGQSDTTSGWRGFRFDIETQQMINLLQTPNTVTNVTTSDAWGVNGDGTIIAGSYGGTGGAGYTFTWTPQNGIAPVSKGGSAVVGVAVMSVDGSVMGGASSTTLQTNGPPARWVNGVFQALPVPAGGTGVGSVNVISDDGLTLGGRYVHVTGPSSTEYRAFVWRADLGAVELLPYVRDTLGLDMQGFTGLEAAGMSRDGLVWVGTGVRNGRSEGWMLRLAGAGPLCAADMGGQGGTLGGDGHLDNNDFVVFIANFFTLRARADMGRQGGLPGGDGHFDNNDFVVFINEFFGGCN